MFLEATPVKQKLERVLSPRTFAQERICAVKEKKIVIYVCAADSQGEKTENNLFLNFYLSCNL